MSNKDVTLKLSDGHYAYDNCNLSLKKELDKRLSAGPKKTKITFRNHDTGEVLGEYENKVLVSGSQFNGMAVFGINADTVFESYNVAMGLDGSKPSGTTPANTPIVCLFCISDSGCGSTPKDVLVSDFTDRIKPAPKNPASVSEFTSDMIMPFRYVDANADLNADLRKYYFGRKAFSTLGKVGYYFKNFDTEPQVHVQYADGTPLRDSIYTTQSTQAIECFVEMRLRITRLDFRDYFEQVLGWDKARISSMSLCFAWYDASSGQYKIYQDITPYTLLNFSFIQLVDLDLAVDIEYQIYY